MCNVCRQTPCAVSCPNFEDEPLHWCCGCNKGIYADETYYEIAESIYCEDCVHDCQRTADRCNSYDYCDGLPVFSYGDNWED